MLKIYSEKIKRQARATEVLLEPGKKEKLCPRCRRITIFRENPPHSGRWHCIDCQGESAESYPSSDLDHPWGWDR